MPKNNDIRVLRLKKLSSIFSELSLNDVPEMLHTPVPTHFDKRTKKWSRIDFIFSNDGNLDPTAHTRDVIEHKSSGQHESKQNLGSEC